SPTPRTSSASRANGACRAAAGMVSEGLGHLAELAERSGPRLAVAARRGDLRAATPGDIGGVVGAVVGHDHHSLRTPRPPPITTPTSLRSSGSRHGPAPARSGATPSREHPWRAGPGACR